jgi:hypothetical protein
MKTKTKRVVYYIVAVCMSVFFISYNFADNKDQQVTTNNDIQIEKIVETLKKGSEKEKDELYIQYNLDFIKHKELIKAILDKAKNNDQLMEKYLNDLHDLVHDWVYANLSAGVTKDLIFPYCDWLNHEWIGCLVVHKEGEDFASSELQIPKTQYLTYIKTMDLDGDKKDEIILYSNSHRSANLFIYKWENGVFKKIFQACLGESRTYGFFTQHNNKLYAIKCNIMYELYKEEEQIFELKDGVYVRVKEEHKDK